MLTDAYCSAPYLPYTSINEADALDLCSYAGGLQRVKTNMYKYNPRGHHVQASNGYPHHPSNPLVRLSHGMILYKK